MLHQLTEDQLDILQRHLIVPVAVSDILYHDLDVEPDMQYGLHMALSEIDPDSALLAIALCANHLAKKCLNAAPIALCLQKEAGDIIIEYGPTWLRHYQNPPIAPEIFEEILETVPEDLEALADLMDALCADLNNTGAPIISLANLLSIQARAHMEIAGYILAEIALEKASGKQTEDGTDSGGGADLIDMGTYKDSNIVLFPGTRD